MRADSPCSAILHSRVGGTRRQGRPSRRWTDEIKDWTGLSINQIKSNLFAIVKMHNKQFIKITFHLAGQTGDSYALMSAHKN